MGSVGFCASKIILYGVVANLLDEYLIYKCELAVQASDFLWVLIILIACRPRKQWPPYFTLSVHEMRSAEGRGNRHDDYSGHAPAPMLVGLISPDFLL